MSRRSIANVWDWPVRICHWTLAGLVIANLIDDDNGSRHRVVGYIAVSIVLARLTWAAVSRSGGSLRPSPSASLLYLRQLRHSVPPRQPGHNPLGIWMVWLIWATVLMLGLTGWMSRLDMFWGDDTIHVIHATLAYLLMACTAIHIVAITLMSWLWKENLALSMLYRHKRSN